jgi:hypothetical protein
MPVSSLISDTLLPEIVRALDTAATRLDRHRPESLRTTAGRSSMRRISAHETIQDPGASGFS